MKARKIHLYFVLAILAFTVISKNVLSQFGPEVTVHTDKTLYQLREIVEIFGNVTYQDEPVNEGLIGIQVESPVRNLVMRTALTGTEHVGGYDFNITSFYSSDEGGNPKSGFERGDWAYFTVIVKNNRPIPRFALVTVSVYDSTLIPITLEYVGNTVPAGATLMFIATFKIDTWASVGKAPAYANVYTGWPKNDGYPQCPETAINYTIKESAYTPAPDNPVPQKAVQNGSYSANFRLSPEPQPGTYFVYVEASYGGLTASFQTQFSVVDVIAPPRAAFTAEPPMAGANITISFDGAFSSPEGYNDTITSYTWDFGDLSNSTGKTATHKYTSLGNYTVTLNVTDSEGFWNTTSKILVIIEIHDISLTSIEFYENIYSDWKATLTVEIENKGTFPESFDVTTYYNGTIIMTKTITDLAPLAKTTWNFQWNTTGLPTYVTFEISAETSIVPGDVNATDNTVLYGITTTKNLGDFDGDRDTDIFDIVGIAIAYGSQSGGANWNIQADMVPSGEIDIFDIVVAAAEFDNHY